MQNSKIIEILWTGGFDSTYRIVQLSGMNVQIHPYYLLDNRQSEDMELSAIAKITEMLKNNVNTKCEFLPLKIVDRKKRIFSKETSEAYKRIVKHDYLGSQYDWLGCFATRHDGIELSIHQNDKAIILINKYGKLKKIRDAIAGDYHIVDCEYSSDDINKLFRFYHFPLADITKLEMRNNYIEWGYSDVMNLTWFCFRPIKGKLCGCCNACIYAIEEGMEERFSVDALKRYRRRKYIFNKLINVTKKQRFYLFALWSKCSRLIKSDALFLKVCHRLIMGEKLNCKNPKTFNQKLQWLKLHYTDTRYTQMVDKYSVREIIAGELGEEYLIPLLGVWNKFEEIDFNALPNQFVLKATHDSSSIIICKDKSKFNIKEARKKLNKALRKNYFYFQRETPYKNVKPRIIAEKYMVDESGVELKDYKLFCFDGRVHFIQVHYDRFSDHKRNIYDTNWNLMNFHIGPLNKHSSIIKKPLCLDGMIEIAEQFSKSIPHVRVDLYAIKDKIFFGEFTFYHGAGYSNITPPEWDYRLGNLIILPK